MVEHVHEEIAERRIALGVMSQITAVLEAPAGEQDGVVAWVVGAGVA